MAAYNILSGNHSSFGSSFATSIDGVSLVVSTPRSPFPALLHLLALQLKPSLSGLSSPGRPY